MTSLSRLRRDREEEDEDGRAGRGEGWRGSTTGPAKRPRRCFCSCCQEIKDFYECQIEILKKEMQCMSKGFIEERKVLQREMQEFYQSSQLQFEENICERMEHLIRDQFSNFISEISTFEDQHSRKHINLRAVANHSKTRIYRLKFESKCCSDKYSRHDIMADDGGPIKVAIYDHDNRIITIGPLSSMQVKIVVLDGEFNNDNKEQWSRDSFRRNIIHARPGKPPLFSNEMYLSLQNGVGSLCGAKFQDNSSFVPSKKFRLGVMAADDSIPEEILEGVSESFSVKDGRGFSKKKDPHPSLSDPIFKLKKIGENGDRHKLLEEKKIKLVQDFLRFYKKDKASLRKACGNITDHDWDIIVEHALSCKPGLQRYSYLVPAMDATVFVDSLYNIVGAEFSGKYSSYEELNDTQKGLVEASKLSAYDNLKVVQWEDKNRCHEHEVTGNKGSYYLKGSCSIQPVPTLQTKFHDDGDGLESDPAQESPRVYRGWRILSYVLGWIFYTKKIHSLKRNKLNNIRVQAESKMCPAPWTENCIGMTDRLGNSMVEPEISFDWDDLSNIVFGDEEWSNIF